MKMGELHKDTMEQDLWDLGDDDDVLSKDASITLPEKKETAPKSPIKTREISSKKQVGEPLDEPVKAMVATAKSPTKGDFDDLDGDKSTPSPKRPVERAAPTPVEKTVPPPEEEEEDEFNPHAAADATPVSLRPALGLSKLERIGLIGLVVIILVGGIWFIAQSLGGLPKESALNQKPEFPIKGKLVTLTGVVTFWREPIEQGENADTVRRGTELLPVANLMLEGGPAAIRIFFVNADGSYVGDPVTRSFSGKSSIEIPATAGFDDRGMHAAYRTGLSNPWSIEIHEAPSINSPSEAFTKILKMTISPDRR